MKLRHLVAGAALAVAVTPLATPASASCGPVVIEACRVVCSVEHPAIRSLCAIL